MIINRIKTTQRGRQDIFCFSKLNLIASTVCTLCAEHSHHGLPRTLGNCYCYSLAEKPALIKHLFVEIYSKDVHHAPGSLKKNV